MNRMNWVITALVALISVLGTLYASGSVFDERYASKESVAALTAAVERVRQDNRTDHKEIERSIKELSTALGRVLGILELDPQKNP